jgi:putative transposase
MIGTNSKYESLEAGCYYHVYNHAVGGRLLFSEPNNYEYFLSLYDKYISPVADTYAWVLMPNHFHFLIKTATTSTSTSTSNLTGFENLSGLDVATKPLHQHFSNFFNAYTKAFNKRYNLWGALFERPFKRKRIDEMDYLKNVILYIHNNPVHHGFCSHPVEYPWSSYLTCISVKSTKLQRQAVVGWFDGEANFKVLHKGKVEVEKLENWLEL